MAYELTCDWRHGFVPDPSKKPRLGYLAWFKGLAMGEYLQQDMLAFAPFKIAMKKYSGISIDAKGMVPCTGVIDRFSWAGGVSDPLCINAYVSAENRAQLKSKIMTGISTAKIEQLAWWICNYDGEAKTWYEEAFPKAPLTVTGQLNAPGGKDVRLTVDETPIKVAPNIDVNVYNVYFEVVPAANQTYALHFASSAKAPSVRNWGLTIGAGGTASI